MGLLSRWKENRIIKIVYREERKKQEKLMKHARNYRAGDYRRKKSLSKYMRSKKAKKKFDAYQNVGVDEVEYRR